jgi:hypothetical protein
MEWWKDGILGMEADDALILIFDQIHLNKIRFYSAKPIIPTFHYSSIPWSWIRAIPPVMKLT